MGVQGTRIADAIRKQIAEAVGTNAEVGRRFGVSPMTVTNIKKEFARSRTLTAPEAYGEGSVSVSMTGEELAQLSRTSGRMETLVVAGQLMSESLRTRLFRAICETGPYESMEDLMRAVRRGSDDNFGAHETYHILRALNQQGLIEYSERGSGASTIVTKLLATERGYEAAGLRQKYRETGKMRRSRGGDLPQHAGDRTDFRTHGPRAEGGPIETRQTPRAAAPSRTSAAPSAPYVSQPRPAPTLWDWPQLDALRERAAAAEKRKARAEHYLAAAVALESVDPEEAERLMAKAADAEGESLSPLEREFLAFAQARRFAGDPE